MEHYETHVPVFLQFYGSLQGKVVAGWKPKHYVQAQFLAKGAGINKLTLWRDMDILELVQ